MHNRIATFITPDITPAQRDEIIAAYLSPDVTLTDLAASQNLSLPDLLAFLELPSTLETLDTLERIAARRDRLLSISARRCALDRLVQLVRVDPTERRLLTPTLEARARETSRRAAATLERLTRPASPTSISSPRPAAERAEPAKPEKTAPPAFDPALARFPSPPSASTALSLRPSAFSPFLDLCADSSLRPLVHATTPRLALPFDALAPPLEPHRDPVPSPLPNGATSGI